MKDKDEIFSPCGTSHRAGSSKRHVKDTCRRFTHKEAVMTRETIERALLVTLALLPVLSLIIV